jgi:hypothetical protein
MSMSKRIRFFPLHSGIALVLRCFIPTALIAAEAKLAWQTEWDKTVKTAEEEGGDLHDAGLRAGVSRGVSEKVSQD